MAKMARGLEGSIELSAAALISFLLARLMTIGRTSLIRMPKTGVIKCIIRSPPRDHNRDILGMFAKRSITAPSDSGCQHECEGSRCPLLFEPESCYFTIYSRLLTLRFHS